MLIQTDTKKRKRRRPRHWKMVQHQSNGHPKKVEAAANAAGENGMYRAIERDARKIDLRGPEYYTGDPRRIARLHRRATSGIAVGMSGVSESRWEQAFGS